MLGLQGVCECRNWSACGACGFELLQSPLGRLFSVRLLVDDEGGDGRVWVKPGDETRFEQVHEVAHLFYPFQCDLCCFKNLKGRDPMEKNGQDTLLLITIRRINLLGM